MTEILVVLISYLIGSIPMAYLLGKLFKRIDIRDYGSGNVGASNVWVHVNKWVVGPLIAFDIFVGPLPGRPGDSKTLCFTTCLCPLWGG